jgi:hypothetical protein
MAPSGPHRTGPPGAEKVDTWIHESRTPNTVSWMRERLWLVAATLIFGTLDLVVHGLNPVLLTVDVSLLFLARFPTAVALWAAAVAGEARADEPREPTAPDPRTLVDEAHAVGEKVTYHADGDPERISPTVRRTAYRVVQESLTNARKHAPGWWVG